MLIKPPNPSNGGCNPRGACSQCGADPASTEDSPAYRAGRRDRGTRTATGRTVRLNEKRTVFGGGVDPTPLQQVVGKFRGQSLLKRHPSRLRLAHFHTQDLLS